MAVKSLDIHLAALAELKSAVVWYEERNETAALNFVAELDRAIDLVIASPGRWPRGERETRKFALQRFPFAIIYREKETIVQCWLSPTGEGGRDTGKLGFSTRADKAFYRKPIPD